jgi:hypothetical protein
VGGFELAPFYRINRIVGVLRTPTMSTKPWRSIMAVPGMDDGKLCALYRAAVACPMWNSEWTPPCAHAHARAREIIEEFSLGSTIDGAFVRKPNGP